MSQCLGIMAVKSVKKYYINLLVSSEIINFVSRTNYYRTWIQNIFSSPEVSFHH